MGQRIRAALVDLALILGWIVLVAAVGVPLYLTGVTAGLRPLQLNLVGAALVVVPVVAGLAATEGGRYEASPGKQWAGLRVRRLDGGRLRYGRSLLRNAVKVGLPWVVGHAAAIALATSTDPVGADVWILTAVAYLLPLAYLVGALLDHGRAPYDVVAGSQVVVTAAGRRVAED